MTWMKIVLRGGGHPVPLDVGSPRARRFELRRRLLSEPGLTGRAALSLARELRLQELREAADSLQELQR